MVVWNGEFGVWRVVDFVVKRRSCAYGWVTGLVVEGAVSRVSWLVGLDVGELRYFGQKRW